MIAVVALVAALASPGPFRLEIPVIEQAPERCGQAALGMVMHYYGAGTAAWDEAETAYDPVLRGSLITDLAAAARRAGFETRITTSTPDSLIALLEQGVPPIVLYQNGAGPLTVRHFAVVVGWDPVREAFTVNDGRAQPRVIRRTDLAKRWRTAGSHALIVRPRTP